MNGLATIDETTVDPAVTLAILADMPAPLRAKYEQIQQLLIGQSVKVFTFFHLLGRHFLEVRDSATYGDNALGQLSAAFNYDTSYVSRIMTFADLFSEDEVKALSDMQITHSRPLSFSVISEVIPVRDKVRMMNLLADAIKNGYTVKQVRAIVENLAALPSSGVGGSGPAPGPQATVIRPAKSIKKIVNFTGSIAKRLAELMIPTVDALDAVQADDLTEANINDLMASAESMATMAEQFKADSKAILKKCGEWQKAKAKATAPAPAAARKSKSSKPPQD